MGLPPDRIERYLSLLDVPRRPPSVEALAELVTAQLARVPFENVSKLRRAHRGLPPGLSDFDEFADGVEHDGLGGTCYLLNPLLGELLTALGYRRELRGADMDQPDVHVVNVVEVEQRPWLVDVGYAAPFFAPLPLDEDRDVRVDHGRESYVLRAAATDGRSRLDHLRDGEVVHGYTVTPGARSLEEFVPIVVDSFREDSTFLNRLRVERHEPGRTVALRDFTVSVFEDGRSTESELDGPAAVSAFLAEEFGIPPRISAEAFAELARRSEAWRV